MTSESRNNVGDKLDIATEDKLYEAAVRQAFELWINPEIERRRQTGRLRDGFALYAAQVIMDMDTDSPTVRLNEEVKAVFRAQLKRAVQKGEVVWENDFDEIEDLELTDLDPNAAHLTIILRKGMWVLKFDFRYNAARIRETIETAREFLDCATFSLNKGNVRAFVENLFGAAELMAKGLLLMHPDRSILTGKSHKIIASKFNWWGKLGNTDPEYVKLLNHLSVLRRPARYLQKRLALKIEHAKVMLAVAEDMFQTLSGEAPKRISVRLTQSLEN